MGREAVYGFFRLLKAAPQNGANKNHLELFGHNCVLIADEEYAQSKKTPSIADYNRMADELEAMSAAILTEPESDREFAMRLAFLAKEMRKDCLNVHFGMAE